MPDPNPNPDPALDPNPDPNPTEPETEETEQQPGRFARLGCWIRTHKAITALVAVLALLVLSDLVIHGRLNRHRTNTWELNRTLFGDALPRINAIEQAMTRPESGILAQLEQIHDRNTKQDNRLDKVEADQSATATAISGLQQFLERKFGDEALTVEEPAAEGAEAEAETPSEPRAEARPVERPAVVTKPVRKSAKLPAARARAAEPAEVPVAAAPVVRARSAPAKPARRSAQTADEFLDAAERIHVDAETLLEGALEGRDLAPAEEARVAEHRRRYQPAAIRPTAWRDVRTDETRVVYVGRR